MNPRPGGMLLVGAGGFVGPWLARAALAHGWSVTGVSRRPDLDHGPGYRHVAADANDPVGLLPSLEGADAVIYNAAYIPADFSDSSQAEACVRSNALAPLAILRALSARPRPFVYISTAQGYVVDAGRAGEDTRIFPSGYASFYLASKLLGDVFTEHHRLRHGVPATVVRAGSIYGPGQSRGMVVTFVESALAGRKIVLRDAGRHQSDLTFVGDLAHVALAAVDSGIGGIFNVGSGLPTTALEAARIVFRAAGASEGLIDVQAPGESPPSRFAALDVTRATRELGFRPTPPMDGLARTVREWKP